MARPTSTPLLPRPTRPGAGHTLKAGLGAGLTAAKLRDLCARYD